MSEDNNEEGFISVFVELVCDEILLNAILQHILSLDQHKGQ